jgi:hypothetical protein
MTTTVHAGAPMDVARRPLAAVLLGGLVLALAACGSPAAPKPAPSPSTSTVVVGPTVEPAKQAPPTPVVAPTWPLTGMAVTGAASNRPALAVKIENTAEARPQEGLNEADVVWENIVEFDVSRFNVVFQSQVPGEIGPIRSVRPMDMPESAPLHGLFAYSGGQSGILALAQQSGEQTFSFDSGNKAFYRTKNRAAPHNVYSHPADIWAQADPSRVAPTPWFQFGHNAAQASAAAVGTPANTLSYKLSAYAHPSWIWDAASATWLRFEGSAKATTLTSGAAESQIHAVNVLTIVASHPNTQFGAQNNTPVPTYTLVNASGDGLLARGGKTIPVKWSKGAQDAPMVVTLADGSPAVFAPGNIWIEMVPKGTGSYTVG